MVRRISDTPTPKNKKKSQRTNASIKQQTNLFYTNFCKKNSFDTQNKRNVHLFVHTNNVIITLLSICK